jgi:hypothetical protein
MPSLSDLQAELTRLEHRRPRLTGMDLVRVDNRIAQVREQIQRQMRKGAGK